MPTHPLTFERIPTNGICLHSALAGPQDGEPVILLHGFPEAWFGWEAQIHALAQAGMRVIAPDQRGYNLSDKPKGVNSYRMEQLVKDILGLADALGYQRFNLAGHDFGAAVAWSLAMAYPERLRRLAIANVPHPDVMRRYLLTHPAQMLKSWYMFFFQIPRLPELLLRAGGWRSLLAGMPEGLNAEEKDRYRSAWGQSGAITGMVNWYRAIFRGMGRPASRAPIQAPTLLIWGMRDPYLSHEMAPLSLARCKDGRLVMFDNATHWVLQDKPHETSRLLIEHFSEIE